VPFAVRGRLASVFHRVQRVGWQEWDRVALKNGAPQRPPTTSPSKAPQPGNDVDWWDIEGNTTNSQSSTSLPLDQWNPLLPHDTGISEIGLTRCLLDPGYGLCFPDTTAELVRITDLDLCYALNLSQDSTKGKWTMVEQDLNMKSGLYFLVGGFQLSCSSIALISF
jgi:hypothetical protein